jgi:lysine N6-hydroxylase
VLGVGTEPYLPPDLAHLPEDRVCVPDDLADRLPSMTERSAPVAVVGGGQTGAECVLELLAPGLHRHPLARPPALVPADGRLAAGERVLPAGVPALPAGAGAQHAGSGSSRARR